MEERLDGGFPKSADDGLIMMIPSFSPMDCDDKSSTQFGCMSE